MINIFIGFASENENFAKKLADRLGQENDYFVKIYLYFLYGGDDISSKIPAEIDKSIIYIPIISENFCKKAYIESGVKTEIDLIMEKINAGMNYIIIPVLLDCEKDNIPASLKDQRYCINFSDPLKFDEKCNELVSGIEHQIEELGLKNLKDSYFDDVQYIDLILKKKNQDPTKIEVDFILNVILHTKDYEKFRIYFLQKLENPFWFKLLLNKGIFSAVPKPIETEKGYYKIPYWPVLDYLERMSKYPEFADNLIKIMKKITETKVDNYHAYNTFMKMASNFPPEKVIEVIPLVRTWLESKFSIRLQSYGVSKLLTHLLKNNQKDAVLRLIEIVTEVRDEKELLDREVSRTKSIMDTHALKELIEENLGLMVEIYPLEIAKVISKNLGKAIETEIRKRNKSDYSYIWRPAIEEHSQNLSLYDIKEILVVLIRDLLKTSAMKKDIGEYIKELLNHQYSVFRRLSIYLITENKEKYESIVNDIFLSSEEKVYELLNDFNIRHELFRFINLHFETLALNKKQFIFEGIKKGPAFVPDELTNEQKEQSKNIRKQEWLEAIKNKGFQPADKLYKEIHEKTKVEIEHPDFTSYMESYTGYLSPYTVEQLLAWDTKEIARRLKEFKEEDDRFRTPSRIGAAETLRCAVSKEPKKFEDGINDFLNIPFCYIYEILLALRTRWEEKKSIDWQKILNFCKDLIFDSNFWSGKEKERSSVISAIADLIEAGTKEDENAFQIDLLPVAKEILIKMAEKETESHYDKKDPPVSVLNSSKGRILLAAITYALRLAKTGYTRKNQPNKRWEPEIEGIFTNELTKEEKTHDVYTVCGWFLPNLNYLDSKWVSENIENIFPDINKHKDFWLSAFAGYLSMRNFYKHIYKLGREQFRIATRQRLEFYYAKERLAQNLVLAYLYGLEDLTPNSVFEQYLQNVTEEDISKCIWFITTLDFIKDSKEYKEKIIKFWKYRYNLIIQNEQENKKEFSGFIELAQYLELELVSPDSELYQMLETSVKYAEQKYKTTEAIEFFEMNCDKYSEIIAKLFNVLLDNLQTPPFEKEEIKHIIETLYQKNIPEITKQTRDIVNKFGEKWCNEDYRKLYNNCKSSEKSNRHGDN